jgi:hypothetical protein
MPLPRRSATMPPSVRSRMTGAADVSAPHKPAAGCDNLAVYMRPLPEQPSFPVYGLDEQFHGFRWLTIWNSPRALYLVDLGHGRPEDGPWISVQTVAKTPYLALTPDSSIGPTGLHDAVTHAAIRLAELSSPYPPKVKRLLDDELARFDYDPTDNRLTLLDGWSADEVSIDGIVHRADSRRVDAAWATVVNLPGVAVAVTGPMSIAMRQIQLSEVSEQIDQYV